MKPKPPVTKRQLDFDLRDIHVEFASEGATSVFLPAAAYTLVRVVAKLLTLLVPMSGTMAFLTTIAWLVAALFVFVVVTWFRDDSWLAAGILIGATFLGGGLLADIVGRLLAPGTFVDAVLSVAGASLNMLVRALLLVPLAGGLVAGTRWLTGEMRRNGVLES